MDQLDGLIAEMQERLRRYPPDRYPVQHATTQFHLGMALVQADRLDEARRAFRTAAHLFDPDGLPVEHAKTLNSLGAVLRTSGRPGEAATAFERAADLFGRGDSPLEQGAALYNLGLALSDQGQREDAVACWEGAIELLDPHKVPGQAAAATRELGATLLQGGNLARATAELERAVELAERAGDRAGAGAAGNALGLAHLAAGRLNAAIEALSASLAANPRTVRPEAYAMAKANLALAWERAGDEPRARLAALQADGTPEAPEPVRRQASEVLERLGSEPGEVFVVLDREARDRWSAVVREEVVRWVDAEPRERNAESAAWVDGQVGRADAALDLAQAWLGSLLELPPHAMERIVRGALEALGQRGPDVRERFHAQTSSAMARFHVPQLMRLRDTFGRIAEEIGNRSLWP